MRQKREYQVGIQDYDEIRQRFESWTECEADDAIDQWRKKTDCTNTDYDQFLSARR